MIRNRQRWFGARSQSSRSGVAPGRRSKHWVLEGLEDRLLLSGSPTTYTVDLTSDTGKHTSALAGDILYCVTQANASTNTAGSVITFDPTVFASPQTITLASTLELSEKAGPEMIQGPGTAFATVSGNNAVQVFLIDAGVTATLSGLTITGGMTTQAGGGIDCNGNVTVIGCTITGNTADSGGGIFLTNGNLTITDTTLSDNMASSSNSGGGGVLDFGAKGMTVTDSIFSGNTASGGGGGVEDYTSPLTISGTTLSGNTAGNGGGIYNYSSPVTIADSTFSSNTSGGFGGAYYDDGGTETFTECTIAGNSAGDGGGILELGTALTVVNCTIADNKGASAGNGGGIGLGTGTLTLDNTIVALNTDGTGNNVSADEISNFDGTLGSSTISTASANNLIGIGDADGMTNGTNNNQVGVNPGLDPSGLQWNGGPTQTIGLAIGSLAIGKGNSALAVDASGNLLASDQRGAGFARTVKNQVDIGAFQTSNPNGYLVDLTSDTGTGSDGAGDLLYCITQANADTNTAGSLIEFAPTVFNPANPQTITLSSTLNLNETAGREVLVGPGASVVTISGNNTVQVLDESQENVTASLAGLTISSGNTSQSGGGIYNDGALTVTSCTFTGNTSGSEGGAIANPGTLTLTSSTLENNSAPFGGGIDNEGMLTMNGSTLENNVAYITGGYGGGIYNYDAVATLTNATFEMNSAVVDGGGIFNTSSSTLTVTDSSFSGNSAESGGAIANFQGDPSSTATVTDSTIAGNSSTGTSSGDGGGGIYNNGGSASITASTLSGNTAYGDGGGILTSDGAMTILDSTVSSNSVSSLSDSSATGGGIDEASGSLTVTNSTIAVNSAQYVGAGIHLEGGSLTAVNSTIAYNNEPSGSSGLGGGMDVTDGTVTLDNTIIALNTDGTGTNTQADNLFIDGSGTVASSSANNLLATGGNSGLTNGVNGNLVGVANPDLSTLANNGGPTQTIALLSGTPGSPAINAGKVSLAVDANNNPLTTDQRGTGFPRTVNGTVDIGAFEGTVAPSIATVYTVDLTSDTGASTSAFEGDILYCVTQANANANLAGSVIEFSPTVFATPQTITLTSTLEPNELSGPEVIDGPGANLVTLSGSNSVQVFNVPDTATVTLSNMTISNGAAASGLGGGIANSGTLTVTNCTLSGNSAEGAIFNSGTLTVTGSTLTDNTASVQARLQGGGIDNSGTLTVTDSTISGNTAFAGGGIENDGTATITGGTIATNNASVFGGGIDNSGTLTVNTATIQGNSVGVNGSGGGINNTGSLTVAGSTIANNSASQSGGSVATGGGISSGGNIATILDTTLSGNSAPSGGGVYVASGPVTVTNSTLAGNTGTFGGGIYIQAGTLTAVNCTIAYNSVAGGGVGGGMDIANGTATLENTIVATNTAGTGGATANDIAGTVFSSSAFNMIGTGGSGGLITGGSQGNLVGVASPDLGALAGNGGPTQTIALLTGSPAINAGKVSLAVDANDNLLTTDQRGTGFARTEGLPPNETIDIGAFEIQTVTNNPVPTLSAILPNRIGVGYASPITLTVTGSGFISQSVVDWMSTALATTYVSSTELTATIPASDFASLGSFPITVVNPLPGGGASTAATFQVLAAPNIVYVNTTYDGDPLGTVVTIDGSTHTVGYDAFGTVQAGVTAVATGGTVNLAAGTYIEQVTINQRLTLAGAGSNDTTIQAPADFLAGDVEITIASEASVAMSGFFVEKPGGDNGLNSGTGIADDGGILTATDLQVFGFTSGVAVENDGAAAIADSTIFDNDFGIVVDSSSSGTSAVTANYDSLAGDNAGVLNLQTSGTIDARFDYWGSISGPTTSANPGGTGAAIGGSVNFNPWLGDANLDPYDYLVFSTTGDNDIVSPISGNTILNITSGNSAGVDPPFGISLATLPGGDTLGFTGSGGVTIRGESGSDDLFLVKDTSVQFKANDGLNNTLINFLGTSLTRNVDAEGTSNSFYIDGAGGSGPSGNLVGDSSTNDFLFDAGGNVLGNIEGGGTSMLNYEPYSAGADVNLGNGTNGMATGVSGTVSGITAVLGSSYQDDLNAGSVPDVTLTGGLGVNVLIGNGAGDSVSESIGSSYTLTNGLLTGTAASFDDYLFGIKTVTLYGTAFNVSGWTGTGSLIDTTGDGTVTASRNANSTNFVLTDTSLQTTDGMSLSLSGITTANLTGTGSGDVFAPLGWTHGGTLKGNNGTVVATESASMTLTNSSLSSGTMELNLSGIKTADLAADPTASQPAAILNATAFSGVSNLTAAGAGNAILYSGSGGHSSMAVISSGNDILIGDAPNMNLSDTGTGHSILIGAGAGGNTLTGNGNDILVSGTTKFDSYTSANIAALDAILAEWTSSASYTNRISKIKTGVGPFHAYAFRSNTVTADPNKNSLADGSLAVHRGDWFLVSSKDHVTRRINEVKTII